jgi:hypothetical protein
MLAQTAGATILGATAAGNVADLTPAQAKTFLAITASDVSGLATVATSGSASDLGSGTLPAGRLPALTGDVTTSVGTVATTIANGAVSLAKMANVATGTLFYRKTAGSGAPEVQTLATLKTDLGLTGTNSGDQTITLTNDVTGSGTGSFATTIAVGAVTLSKMANLAANSIIGNNTGSAATPIALTASQVKSLLAIANTDVSGLGTASTANTGTSGGTVPLLNGANTWSAGQAYQSSILNTGSNMLRVEATGGAAPAGASGAGLEFTSSGLTAYNRTTDAYAALSIQASSIALRISGSTVGNVTSSGLLMISPLGYGTGAGATVTQTTNRTTGVTINALCGKITLVSAAGSSTWNSFTVTNSQVAATDTVIVNQSSGANLYNAIVTNVGSGSFKVSISAVSGTATEAPAFNFAVIKAVTS